MQYALGPVTILNPHGVLALEKYLADDLDVVNAAKASFAQHVEEMGAAEHGLIGFLMREHHGSPFEHNYFKFHVRAPIAVARDWVRHRIGTSWNEESGRYTLLRPDFYIPEPQHVRSQVGKPGSYTFEPITDPVVVADVIEDMTWVQDQAFRHYQGLLGMGVAKELARYVLPVGTYTEWIWSCNARSLMHFLTLRNAPDAMLELRLFAYEMEKMFQQIMPVTAQFFRELEQPEN
jgi:thymidylate synthase (FAD)